MAGVLYSIGAALFWSIAVILFRKSGDSMSPIPLNLFKCLVSLLLLIPTLLIMGVPFFPDCPINDWWKLALSGIIGITLADVLFFASLNRLGAGLSAIVSCFYLPTVIILSYLFLGERLGTKGLLGGGFVLSALFVSAARGKAVDIEKKDLGIGLIYGFLGTLGLVIGILIVKDVLNRSDVVWATTVRLACASIGMVIMLLFHQKRKQFLRKMAPSDSWEWAVPGSIMGNYFALLCWLAGMKYTLVSLAAILNQLSAIMIFILAAIFLKESITLNRLASIGLAFIGAVIAVYN